jgi:hypothetical protein
VGCVWGVCGVPLTPYVRHSTDCTCCDFGHLRFTYISIMMVCFFQPCLTKTDAKSGLVTRNCSPVKALISIHDHNGCHKDVHGNKFCYCFEDLCNPSSRPTMLSPSLMIFLTVGTTMIFKMMMVK